jgi:hypothetical protein
LLLLLLLLPLPLLLLLYNAMNGLPVVSFNDSSSVELNCFVKHCKSATHQQNCQKL